MNEPSVGRRVGRLPLVLAFLAVYIIWGSTYLAIRFGVASMPPFLMAGVRHFVPGLILFAWARARGAPAPTRTEWRSAAVVGLFLLLGANGLVTWAEQWVPSGLTALLLATMPLCMGVLGGLVEAENRPGRRGIAGILLGLAGVAILVEPRGELASDVRVLIGALGILAAAFLWSTGSLLSRRLPLPKNGALATGMQMIAGGVGCLVVGLAAGESARVDVAAVTMRSFVSLLYLIVFGSLVAFSAFTWLLRVAPPAKVATYAYVNPVVAVFLGWALAGETVSARTLIASAVIIVSVVMITAERAGAAPSPRRVTTDGSCEEPA